ncbi:hypothetical protein CEUSTIGMA_g825.t1 [Chlamydomonas eustigma]|uniref:WH1 domain-containing protein n=1 Tax=Chlamydomonas eustigma TaxID=1157962 RepID=A0A250WRS5_9CHLO|nr:hypothetical protein CEUSTIGMA_g825.t1 [Chlamydomonas eustigma]|eukprot:GAX73372.1 hypothetical protein CEUSTIGMA_g825.t1 [Chlamydomonas eustigma]
MPDSKDNDLQTLRLVDPDVDEVLETAAHVCLYHMHVTTQQWVRKNVEGSLFLLKRRREPRFQMMVLNRLSTDNYVETVHAGLDFEVNAPYLMYTHGNSEIHGIWFYEQQDLDRLSALLDRVKSGLPRADLLPQNAPSSEGASFWDREVTVIKEPVRPPPQPQPQQAPSAAPTTNLTNLFKQAHMKQQQQQGAVQATPVANMKQQLQQQGAVQATPVANMGPVVLTPSFFQKQTDVASSASAPTDGAPVAAVAPALSSKHHNDLRKAAALSPANSVSATDTGGAAKQAGEERNRLLQKLFSKTATGESSDTLQQAPVAAPPLPLPHAPQQQQKQLSTVEVLTGAAQRLDVTSGQHQQHQQQQLPASSTNVLSRLFASSGAHPPHDRGVEVWRQLRHAAQMHGPPDPRYVETNKKVREALTNLMTKDEFVDMMAEELIRVGLVKL